MALLPTHITTILNWFNPAKTKANKLNTQQQIFFLDALSQLLDKGFSIHRSFEFLGVLMRSQQAALDQLTQALRQGYPLEKALQDLGFSLTTVANLFYAQRQGRLNVALSENASRLKKNKLRHQTIMKQISYPLVMALFLVFLLFGMRAFLLPYILNFISEEIYQTHLLVRSLILFFTFLPHLFLGFLAILIIGLTSLDLYLLKQSYIKRYSCLVKSRLTRQWTQWYCTAQFANVLGYFFQSGFSLNYTLNLLIQYPVNPFLSEVASQLNQAMSQGQSFTDTLTLFPFFTEALPLVIYQGELTSQVATQCLLYAEKLSLDFQDTLNKKISYLQPILFIIIAILVLAMYLIIMLPMLTMDLQ